MIAVWIGVALALGLFAGRFVRGTPGPAKREPGRARPMKLVAVDPAKASTLDAIVEAIRAAAGRVERRFDGFDLIDSLDPATRLAVRVTDRTWIPATSLACGDTTSIDQPFVLALALVPLYGTLAVTIDDETYDVDGTRDRHQLVRELSRRQTEKMRKLLAERGLTM